MIYPCTPLRDYCSNFQFSESCQESKELFQCLRVWEGRNYEFAVLQQIAIYACCWCSPLRGRDKMVRMPGVLSLVWDGDVNLELAGQRISFDGDTAESTDSFSDAQSIGEVSLPFAVALKLAGTVMCRRWPSEALCCS